MRMIDEFDQGVQMLVIRLDGLTEAFLNPQDTHPTHRLVGVYKLCGITHREDLWPLGSQDRELAQLQVEAINTIASVMQRGTALADFRILQIRKEKALNEFRALVLQVIMGEQTTEDLNDWIGREGYRLPDFQEAHRVFERLQALGL